MNVTPPIKATPPSSKAPRRGHWSWLNASLIKEERFDDRLGICHGIITYSVAHSGGCDERIGSSPMPRPSLPHAANALVPDFARDTFAAPEGKARRVAYLVYGTSSETLTHRLSPARGGYVREQVVSKAKNYPIVLYTWAPTSRHDRSLAASLRHV